MLITRFARHGNSVVVYVDRDVEKSTLHMLSGSELSSLVFCDKYIKFYELNHPTRHTLVGYRLEFRERKHPKYCSLAGTWYFSVFYRRPGRKYPTGRMFRTLYSGYVFLYKFGKNHSDYHLVGRNPPLSERKSDIRFGTIPSPHPIETS